VTWTILTAAFCYTIVAACGGLLTTIGPWYRNLKKPRWQPPDWAFAPAWTTIFACAATSVVYAWYAAPDGITRILVVGLYVINAVLNIAWSYIFFRRRRPDWALREVALLWASILVIILVLWPWSRQAAFFMLPYLLWVSFAAFLNWTVVWMNWRFTKTE
jgi:tryptophan-rich sensory protein